MSSGSSNNIRMDNPVIRCCSVSKTVHSADGPLTILENVNFEIFAGETVAIVGHSGSGKTTLLSLLAGLDISTAGTIELFRQKLNMLDEEQRTRVRNEHVGFVFQAFHLLPGFTALENVMLPLEIRAIKDARPRAEQMLRRVGVGHRLHHYPVTLSGGEQQRVAIARAFVSEPPLLLADEPTGNLDGHTGEHIIDLLFEVNRDRSATMVLVTHDTQLSERCDRRFELSNGTLSPCS